MKNKILMLIFICYSCATVNQSEGDLINLSEDLNKFFEEYGGYEFAKEALTTESLSAYELVAIDQFIEFVEQIKIAVNPSYEVQFQEVAKEAVSDQLIKDKLPTSLMKGKKVLELNQFLTELTEIKIQDKKLYKIAFASNFTEKKDGVYEGRIDFHFNDALESQSIDVYLIKVTKDFGTDRHTIWEIKFGYF